MTVIWMDEILTVIITLGQILTAGVAITALSLFFYALSFNLRDRVARSFAIILLCVAIVFAAEALESSATAPLVVDFFLRFEWVGIVFLPAAYLHLSDALLVTVGRPSRGRRRLAVRLMYVLSTIFLLLLAEGYLVGPLVAGAQPTPYLQRTLWTEIFTLCYVATMAWAGINFLRAYRRTLTRSGRRRLMYLLAGATAPALGCFPYLLYGSSLAARHPFLFWGAVLAGNALVEVLLIVMAYAVAFFGVSWPDRVVKTRLLKWLLRGPVTASAALAVMTIVRRAGELFGVVYSGAVPAAMVATVLLLEHTITLLSPLWEKVAFAGKDSADLSLLRNLEDRLITRSDLRQFLEAVLAALRDLLQSPSAFIAALDDSAFLLLLATDNSPFHKAEADWDDALEVVRAANGNGDVFLWHGHWLFPLFQPAEGSMESQILLGLVGVENRAGQELTPDQRQAVQTLLRRALLALQDRRLQQRVVRSLEELHAQVDIFQRWRAAGPYNKRGLLAETLPPEADLVSWIKDALTHYWGGPRLTQSPLLQLRIVQQALEQQDNPANALRAVLRQAIDGIRPQGERRFTAEWILYNILEMKFIEGRKVREVASRLAMSEADLYRKQRVALEAVARVILEMERQSQSLAESPATPGPTAQSEHRL